MPKLIMIALRSDLNLAEEVTLPVAWVGAVDLEVVVVLVKKGNCLLAKTTEVKVRVRIRVRATKKRVFFIVLYP